MSEHPSPSHAEDQPGGLPPQQDQSHVTPPQDHGGNPQRLSVEANPNQHPVPPQDNGATQHQNYLPVVSSAYPNPFTQHPVLHAPQGNTFGQPQSSRKKKALLVGVNYFGQHGELPNCVRDARNMLEFLVQNHGYKREDIVILTDDQQTLISQPIKANILRAMHWLTNDAQSGDSLFFHYAGHGGRAKTGNEEEPDGLYDEVIYPVDFRQTGYITDDEIYRIMAQPLPPGVRLTAIFDSVHAGSALDLPYTYSTQGMLKGSESALEVRHTFLGVISENGQEYLSDLGNSIIGFVKAAADGASAGAYNRTATTKGAFTNVVVFFGKQDDQTSANSTVPSSSTSAMSEALIAALKKNPWQNYDQLLHSVEEELSIRHLKPYLACSYPLDLGLPLVI